MRLPRLSAVMDEPASLSHLAHVIEASVVVTPHGCGHEGEGKEHRPELKAAPVKTEILAGSIFGVLLCSGARFQL